MKRSFVCVFLAVLVLAQLAAGASKEKEDDVLTVYCYDSFASDWGPGGAIVEGFKAKTGIDVRLVSCGSGAELAQRLRFEGGDLCDVVVGLDDSTQVDLSLFAPANLPSSIQLAPSLAVEGGVLVPFDYGVYAFVADTSRISDLPSSLEDLAKEEYKDRVILIDPRTSSVGMGLLLWTVDVFGKEGALQWWGRLRDNALTIAESWSSAYGLFTEGEAPLVVSYTTSPVYHVMNEDRTDIRALQFAEGHRECVEYAGILASSPRQEEARAFLQYLLTDAQEAIAVDNSMFPANPATILPEAFDYAPLPKRLFSSGREALAAETAALLEAWSLAMVD